MLDAKTTCDPCFAARLYRAIAMFLSVRMRATVKRLGYGPATPSSHDEIEAEMREDMHLAGVRLERMLKQLMASALRS
jgi:CRP/FNR family transcriptional regulator, cyclic AMP receptor protein